MSVDISIFFEQQKKSKWELTKKPVLYKTRSLGLISDKWYGPFDEGQQSKVYELYYILKGNSIIRDRKPIRINKGLPDNCCEEIKNHYKRKMDILYNCSWISAPDLIEVNWEDSIQDQPHWFITDIIEPLKKIKHFNSIRMIYWFY